MARCAEMCGGLLFRHLVLSVLLFFPQGRFDRRRSGDARSALLNPENHAMKQPLHVDILPSGDVRLAFDVNVSVPAGVKILQAIAVDDAGRSARACEPKRPRASAVQPKKTVSKK